MTIIIGAIHEGIAYIGCDSLYTWNNDFVRTSKTSKFIPMSNDAGFLVAGAGQDKYTQIFIRAMRRHPEILAITNLNSMYMIADVLQNEVMKNSGVGEADNNELPEHDVALMFVSKLSSSIFVMESDYSVMEYDDYVCTGSGFMQGEAAMAALYAAGIKGREAVELALNITCELHPNCGKPIEIRELKLEI